MSPISPARPRPAAVRIEIEQDLVHRFAAITGDVSSLHVDDAFARRSQYRRPVVHGMLPLAFLPLLEILRREGFVCRLRDLTGHFSAPVFAGDTVALSADAGGEDPERGTLHLDYRVVVEDSGATAATGTIGVAYEPRDGKDSAPVVADPGAYRSSASLLASPVALGAFRIDEIEKGLVEPPLEVRVTPGVVQAWRALVAAGGADPADGERAVAAFDLPSLLAMLLFSTSVGVSLPGASATFLEFSAAVKSPLAPGTPYRLESRVAHRSKATTIVNKAVTVAPEGGEPVIEAKLAALVNPPAGIMPSVEELRAEALDLGVRDKVVLVTGASRGLGETIAKLFALSGARVVVNYHRGADDADRIVRELTEAGAQALAVRADVSDPDDVHTLVGATVERFGTVDVLVNNAARDYRPIPFSRLTWEDVSRDLDVIVKGALLCCQEVVPSMKARGSGKIVNVGSLATEAPPPDQTKYVIAKSALVGLTRSLAAELAPHGVQVNMVVPHFVETDLVAHVQKGFRTRIAEEVPMRRLATPAEVAQAVVYLASSWAGFTTGQKLMVTGGSLPLL